MDNRIFILCGEASGDVHSANLVKALKSKSPNLKIVGWGGPKLEKQGVRILKNIKELSFMGFWEVLINILKIKQNFRDCKAQLIEYEIDTLILVDYPGFNLRMAKWAHERNIKVFYYISPQVWAWKRNRVYKIKKYVDFLYCILPFESEFYAQYDMEAYYFGHPLLDEIKAFNEKKTFEVSFDSDQAILAILPGSRKQEIEKKLPVMLEAASYFLDEYKIIVACAPNLELSYYQKFRKYQIEFVQGKTYDLLASASLAIVTSGTATLETALFHVPQVVCYKSSWFSYQIAKRLIQVKYISLVNLILDKQVVSELIQDQFTKENIVYELKKIEENQTNRKLMLEDYNNLVQLLGNSGASNRIAEDMLTKLS